MEQAVYNKLKKKQAVAKRIYGACGLHMLQSIVRHSATINY
jgi:hypothetical protein